MLDSNDRRKKENKGIGRSSRLTRKKLLLFFLIGFLILGTFCEAAILIGMTTSDKRFERAINYLAHESWNDEFDETTLQVSAKTKDLKFIIDEYDIMKKYEDVKLKDGKLDEFAHTYINSLTDCKNAMQIYKPEIDYDRFWAEFSTPYGQRVKSLYSLMKDGYIHSESKSESVHQESIELSGWALQKTEDIEFRLETDSKGVKQILAKVKNDSGYDLEFINVNISLFDKKGNEIKTVSAYEGNIKKKEVFELKAYVDEDVVESRYIISSVTCDAELEKP